jgi:hypothetical protein
MKKKREATEAAQQPRTIGRPGRWSTSVAREMAKGSNGVVHGPRSQADVDGRGDEEEMADVDEEEEAAKEARDITMDKTETATTTATGTKIETDTGVLATKD